MKVGMIQSSYIPWRGYFDFINSVDTFVFYDNVQYTRRDWRNRNLIKMHNGLQWITVPVINTSRMQKIIDTKINYSNNWMQKHLKTLKFYYNKSNLFSYFFYEFQNTIDQEFKYLAELNYSLIKNIMNKLNITTKLLYAQDYAVQGDKTERIVRLLEHLGATTYIVGPSAASYINLDLFAEAGIGLQFKNYDYDPYPQLYPPFAGNVSILDLLFNVGPDAKRHITSKTPNTIALPTPQYH